MTGPVVPSGSPGSCQQTSGDTQTLYDADGRVDSYVDQSGNATTYSYGDAGYPDDVTRSVVDGLDAVTAYSYDADGRNTATTDPEGNTNTVGYNADGLPCFKAPFATSASCSGTLPTGKGVTQYTYYPSNQTATMVDNAGTSSQTTSNYSYDPEGNLLSSSDDNGRTVSYSYDYAGQVSCIAYPVAPGSSCGTFASGNSPSTTNTVVDYSTNANGQLTGVTDWLGNEVQYGNYNALGEPGTITYPASTSESLSYGYDSAGNLKTATYNGNVVTNNSLDSWNYNGDEQVSSYSSNVGPGSRLRRIPTPATARFKMPQARRPLGLR